MMATSSRDHMPEIDEHRRTQNRLAQRRHRQKKALEKQAALEQQQPLSSFGALPITPDYGGSSLQPPGNGMPFNAFDAIPSFSEQDLSLWDGVLTPWENGSGASTESNPSAPPSASTLASTSALTSDSSPPFDLMALASESGEFDTPEAARRAALDYWHRLTHRDVKPQVFSNDRNETLVHTAARGNDIVTLKLLIQHGFPVNGLDGEGRTPLHVAYAERHMEAILFLLENGADVTVVDNQGRSTLSMAVNNKCPIGVKLMLSHGAAPTPAS